MGFTQFSYDMDIISKLSDSPNVDDGLTAAQLKARFDEGGKAIKDYINATLLPNLAERPDFHGLVKSAADGFAPAVAGEDYQKPLGQGDVTAIMLAEDVTPAAIGAAAAATAVEVVLSGWVDKAVTVDVPGVTAEGHVIVTPHPDSYVAWADCMVRAAAQLSGRLRFVCEDVPDGSITANVLIVG